MQIEDAERGRIHKPPWCSVKTQFGPVETHVTLVELLRALREDFLANLEVSDEGGYWESRNLQALVKQHTILQAAGEGIKEGLERHGLSREAAEDPEIVATRVEWITAQVQQIIARPSEHADPFPADDESEPFPDPDKLESRWDAIYRSNRRLQERLHRAVEERLQNGEPHDEAFENILPDIGISVPGDPSVTDGDDEEEELEADWSENNVDTDEDESWSDSDETWQESHDEDDDEDLFDRDQYLLLQQATDLYHRLHPVIRKHRDKHDVSLRTLFQGAGELMGGLSHAIASCDDEEEYGRDPNPVGLHIVQLKRALRGASFARGALFQLRQTVDKATIDELHEILKGMNRDVFQLLGKIRAALHPDE